MNRYQRIQKHYDMVLVGGGIMSATLATMLKLIDPNIRLLILEKFNRVARESSGAWNNAGTGHSGFCELNYTPVTDDGSVDITKAIQICTQFERAKQYWSYLIRNSFMREPREFIHPVPHHSWVMGKENSDFLRKRFEAMKENLLFYGMEFSTDFKVLEKWFPLIMTDRKPSEKMAATRMELGTEVNYEKLTQKLFRFLDDEFGVKVFTEHEVLDIDPLDNGEWVSIIKDNFSDKIYRTNSSRVFIGAGGGALPLLQKVEIDERDGYGGFPVSGEWLICSNRDVVKKHFAKVYSKAGLNAPPMSVPHLDTRYINGRRELLFGPFAGFSTKFLKKGSYLDWFKSIRWGSIPALWGVFWHNLPLTQYLVGQVMMNHEDRMEELRKFIKDAKSEDWRLKVAGQRVQVIKRDKKEGGVLEFGTELVHSKDGKITAILGASPGASTAVHIILQILKLSFPEEVKTDQWSHKLTEMIPFWDKDVAGNEEEFKSIRRECSATLRIKMPLAVPSR